MEKYVCVCVCVCLCIDRERMREIKKGMTHQLNGSRSSKGKYSALYCYRRRGIQSKNYEISVESQLQLFFKEKSRGCEIAVACSKLEIKRSKTGCSIIRMDVPVYFNLDWRETLELWAKFYGDPFLKRKPSFSLGLISLVRRSTIDRHLQGLVFEREEPERCMKNCDTRPWRCQWNRSSKNILFQANEAAQVRGFGKSGYRLVPKFFSFFFFFSLK